MSETERQEPLPQLDYQDLECGKGSPKGGRSTSSSSHTKVKVLALAVLGTLASCLILTGNQYLLGQQRLAIERARSEDSEDDSSEGEDAKQERVASQKKVLALEQMIQEMQEKLEELHGQPTAEQAVKEQQQALKEEQDRIYNEHCQSRRFRIIGQKKKDYEVVEGDGFLGNQYNQEDAVELRLRPGEEALSMLSSRRTFDPDISEKTYLNAKGKNFLAKVFDLCRRWLATGDFHLNFYKNVLDERKAENDKKKQGVRTVQFAGRRGLGSLLHLNMREVAKYEKKIQEDLEKRYKDEKNTAVPRRKAANFIEGEVGAVTFAHKHFLCANDADDCKVDWDIVGDLDKKGVTGIQNQSFGARAMGGNGFVMAKITSKTSDLFAYTDGQIDEQQLDADEVLYATPGCILAHTNAINLDIEWHNRGKDEDSVKGTSKKGSRFTKELKRQFQAGRNALIGGNGLVLVKVTGPGKVWICDISQEDSLLLPQWTHKLMRDIGEWQQNLFTFLPAVPSLDAGPLRYFHV